MQKIAVGSDMPRQEPTAATRAGLGALAADAVHVDATEKCVNQSGGASMT